MLFGVFCSVPPSIGVRCIVGAYCTTKLSYLTDLHYRIVTPSAHIASKVTYGADESTIVIFIPSG